MEACCAQIKFTQTEDGFRIDFTGQEAIAKCYEKAKSECCIPEEEKK